ncbi:MAG: zinc ribbon domain-containing protein [Oscillospiraceae bacterium]|nr:zinc ribbon domain-containing protein [Oscillospiraceae bacterium]
MEWVIGFAAIAVAAVAAVLLVAMMVRRVRRLARSAFGTDSLLEGLTFQREALAETPKSVSSMTKIYLPQIAEDFPAFHYGEFKQKAENMLRSAFAAVSGQDPSLLTNASAELKKQVSLEIQQDRRGGLRRQYRDVVIHRTEIARYQKGGGRCTVTLQSAVGHRRFTEQDGALASGSRDEPVQTKYNIELIYIQDVSHLNGASGDHARGLTCPNCGAPVTGLGAKVCDYCGSAVEELNAYAWEIDRFYEVR